MNDLKGSRICGGNTDYIRKQSDFYPTPPDATNALLDFLGIPSGANIWEPACGENHMVDVFEKRGYLVTATDISTGTDFLKADLVNCDWIITNPPFSLSQQFIERCIAHKKPFALLLKSQYWHAKKRLDLFRRYQPEYILPLTWRPDFLFKQRGAGSPLMDVTWVVWGGSPAEKTEYIPISKPKDGTQ